MNCYGETKTANVTALSFRKSHAEQSAGTSGWYSLHRGIIGWRGDERRGLLGTIHLERCNEKGFERT
jgi:hypothetical protein